MVSEPYTHVSKVSELLKGTIDWERPFHNQENLILAKHLYLPEGESTVGIKEKNLRDHPV